MSDKELLSEAAFELRNYEFTELAAAVQRAADAADSHVRVPRSVLMTAMDLLDAQGEHTLADDLHHILYPQGCSEGCHAQA